MRKVILPALILILVASAGAYIYFYQPFSRATAMETVLPADTAGFVRVCELKKQIERFKAGRLGRKLAGIDLPGLMEATRLPPGQRQAIMQALENFTAAIDSAWFDILFGQDILLALQTISLTPQQLAEADLQSLAETLVVVARPKQPTRVLESLNSMFATQLAVQTEDFQQWKLNRFALENGQLVYYALTNDLMIAGLSAQPVQRCLVQSLDTNTSLIHAPAYQKYAAALFKAGETDLFGFADAGRILAFAQEAVSSQDGSDPEMAVLKTQLERLQGIESVNFAQYDDGGDLVHAKMIVGIDKTRMTPTIAQAMGGAPVANPTLKHIPSEALVYNWQNTFDLKAFWQAVQQQPEMTPETVAAIKETFAMKTGMELEPFLATLGTQAGLLIKDINTGGMFPIPELALFIEVREPDAIDQLIRRQVGQFNMPLSQEDYKGTLVHYVMLPTGADMSPAYMFSDGFCTLAVNRALLQGMLDAPEAGHLGGHPDFKALGREMTEQSNQIYYLRTAGLFAKVRDLITWGMTWMAMAKPDEVEQTKRVVELGIYPLLDGLSMIKAVGGRSYSEEDHFSSDVQVLLERT